MTTVQQPFNLLFSLPDAMITEIFGTFDSTHRIFHTPAFLKKQTKKRRGQPHPFFWSAYGKHFHSKLNLQKIEMLFFLKGKAYIT